MQFTAPQARSAPVVSSLPPALFCRPVPAIGLLVLMLAGTLGAGISTFEDVALPQESHWNGSDGSGGFLSGDAFFTNDYNAEWDFWAGFACSSRTDVNVAGMDRQYVAVAGSGQGGSANYAVAFVGWENPPTITFAQPQGLAGLYVTNNAYAGDDMRLGSPFSKRFGGSTGQDQDWFKLTITGLDPNDRPAGTVEFYLADLRSDDSGEDYILDTWAFVDLACLGVVTGLQFSLDSSDQGVFGMNTPAYFCLDTIIPWQEVSTFEDVVLPPESHWNGSDGSGGFASGDAFFANDYNAEWDFWAGFACSNRTNVEIAGMDRQYVAIPGGGQGDSANYAVAFVGWESPPTITFAQPQGLAGLHVTNNAYACDEMRQGSPFSKRFGGPAGEDPDWFKLTITGFDPNDQPTGAVEFYLADLRSDDSSEDYILDTWAFVDLASLGVVKGLQFRLDSSDQGAFGMNTPAYFCLDTIIRAAAADSVVEPEPPASPHENTPSEQQ